MATTVFEESNDFHYEKGDMSVTRVLRVTPYTDHIAVAAILLGTVVRIGNRLVRLQPARHPLAPWCFAKSIDVKGVGAFLNSNIPTTGANTVTALANVGTYEQGARMTVNYHTFDFTQDQGAPQDTQSEIELASESFDFSSQQLSLPGTQFVWSAGTELIQNTRAQLVKTLPRIDYSLTRHFCILKPMQAILLNLGKINKSNLVVAGTAYPPDTVRFDGAQITRKITFTGLRFYDIVYKFAINATYDSILLNTGNITAATNVNPIAITSGAVVPTTGTIVSVSEVGGNTAANGVWTITNTGANTFTIPVSGNGAYTSGGRWATSQPGYVGWNRLLRYSTSIWEKPNLTVDPNRFIHQYDEDFAQQTINGATVKGFQLLFNLGAV